MQGIKNLSASTKFKKTPIGEIPVDWSVVKLGDVISLFQNGIWGEKPSANDMSFPVIRSTEITYDCKINVATVEYRKVPEDKVDKYKLKDGDILIVSSSGSPHLIGRVAQFKHNATDKQTYLFSNFMIRIRPQGINSTFLFYYLNSYSYFCFLKNLQQTSTGLRNLPRTELINFYVPLPPLSEQEKIAAVLTSVDDTIEKTQQLIEQTKKLQKALTQELLTKGIPGLHKKYKKTIFGDIPVDWEIVRLGDVLIVVKNGLSYKQSQNAGRYSITRIETISEGVINADKVGYLDHLTDEEIRNNKLTAGDILFSNINSLEHIAKTAIYLSSHPMLIHGMNLLLLRPNRSKIEPFFLLFYLKFNETINRFRRLSKKAINQVSINQTEIKNFLIPLPSLNEQKSIVNSLLAIEHNLVGLLNQKLQIETLKQSLMQVLLTGKVRLKK